jgi:5-deoxy-D-glucuronate isomerase
MATQIQDHGQGTSPRYVKEYTRSDDNSRHTLSGDVLTEKGKHIAYPHTHIVQDSSGTIISARNEDNSLNTHPKKNN